MARQSKNLTTLITLLCMLFSANMANAGSESSTPTPHQYNSKWEYSVYLGSTSLNEDSAAAEDIDSKAIGLGFTADHDSKWLLTTISAELLLYDDNAGFSQQTRDTFGSTDTSSSSASGFLVGVATGPKWKLGSNKDTLLYIQGGLAHMFQSDRSIDRCSNCRSEDIDIEGGAFAKAGILQNAGSVSIGLNITQFLGSDDIDSNISFVLSTRY